MRSLWHNKMETAPVSMVRPLRPRARRPLSEFRQRSPWQAPCAARPAMRDEAGRAPATARPSRRRACLAGLPVSPARLSRLCACLATPSNPSCKAAIYCGGSRRRPGVPAPFTPFGVDGGSYYAVRARQLSGHRHGFSSGVCIRPGFTESGVWQTAGV